MNMNNLEARIALEQGFLDKLQGIRDLMEAMRRERPNINPGPLTGDAFDSVGAQIPVLDYSAACSLIDNAVHHLDEGLPIGQMIRCSAALAMLMHGVGMLHRWMSLKGYATRPEDLDAMLNGIQGDEPLKVPRSLVVNDQLVSGQSLEQNGSQYIVTNTNVVDNETTEGVSAMQIRFAVQGNDLVHVKSIYHHEVHDKIKTAKLQKNVAPTEVTDVIPRSPVVVTAPSMQMVEDDKSRAADTSLDESGWNFNIRSPQELLASVVPATTTIQG